MHHTTEEELCKIYWLRQQIYVGYCVATVLLRTQVINTTVINLTLCCFNVTSR